MFCLPPNVTHVAQPLDVTPFNSLKVHWDHVCDQYMTSNPGKLVTIQVWNRLFSHAWLKAMTPVTIMSGFRLAGVYPFNQNAITVPGTEDDLLSTPTAKLAHRHGIKYMPFHSPRPLGQAPNQKPCTICNFLRKYSALHIETETWDF